MLNEQLLCAQHASHSVLKAVHLSRQIFYFATPEHILWRKEQKKGDLEEIAWSKLVIL